MNTITQDVPFTFAEALSQLVAGECIGIAPCGSHDYLELYNPFWMTKADSPKEMLRWANTTNNSSIRTTEYLGQWNLVIKAPMADFLNEFVAEPAEVNRAKSAIVRDIANKLNVPVIDVSLSVTDINDVLGLPIKHE